MIKKYNQFINESNFDWEGAEEIPEEKPQKARTQPEYWNWERELVVNKILDKGTFKDVEKRLITKLTSLERGYTIGQLEEDERRLYNELLGKKEMDPTKRQKFWSTG